MFIITRVSCRAAIPAFSSIPHRRFLAAGFSTSTAKMAQVPQSMSGIVIEANGGTEVLKWKEDIPTPSPSEGEILVRNEVTGVNFIDT